MMPHNPFVCRIGRPHKDLQHPTCRSCQAAGVKCGVAEVKGQRKHYQSWVEERDGKKVLVCTFDLKSLNAHVNKANGAQIYRGFKATWQRLLGYRKDGKGSNIALLFFGPHRNRRRRLEVVRYIKSRRQSMDETNLQGSLKPIEDTLVLAGVLKDDRREWLDRVPPLEKIDKENPRVEITVE